ncbi:extracellular solute-binding protein [Paenibacillus sp. HB172176]|uniref:extracellular solute-binding protein n=1 Tax=Paenibacillus sp. HB172176 TaxID=2493690 RepID=UPI001439EC8F|nr:extracellular solute-binding protein [Paenibacillus sp. HB172176]
MIRMPIAKKSIQLTSTILLASSLLLSACSSGNNNNVNNNENTSPSSSNQGSDATAEPTKGPKPKITVSVYDRNNVPEEEGTITDNRWTKWIQENAPVDVEFVPIPRTNSAERWNVLFASGDAPDLIFEFSNAFMREIADKGQLMPLDDLIENHSTTYKQFLGENPLIQKLTKHNGETYFFGRIIPMTTNHFLMIRKDWLDKLGLDVPKTTEEFLNVAKAFTYDDPDGNKKDDTLGATFQAVDFFYQLNNIPDDPITSYFLENDELKRSWDRPAADLAFKKAMYEAGVVDKDIFADKNGAKAQQDWLNGKLGIWGMGGLEGGQSYSAYETFVKNNPDADVMILPLPETEFGSFAPAGGTPMQFTAAINATAKNPEAVMQYIDWLSSEDVAKTLMYGFEGEHYKIGENGCPKPIDPEKNKKELSWNGDMYMLANTGLMGECAEFSNQLDPSKPLDQAYLDLIKQGRDAYLTPDRPLWKELEFSPALPADMLVTTNTVKNTMTNIYTKAIVGGPSVTVEQAMKDAQKAWESAGGKKIDDFYAKSYADNKENIIHTDEYFKYIRD